MLSKQLGADRLVSAHILSTQKQTEQNHRLPRHLQTAEVILELPCCSGGKESACDAGDSSLIPGLGSSAGEGIGYPLQYSWTSLVAQMVKNPSAMWEA